MSDRRKVLELFEEQKDFTDRKVSEGIEKFRKGNGEITVVDECGEVIPGAKILLKQKSHEFRFGANLFMLDELETEEKNEAYKKYFAEAFNMATLPFYWDTLEPEKGKTRYDKNSPKIYRRPAIDLGIEFCEKNGIEPREHALAYEHFFPKWLYDASVFEIKCALENRYREISERYKDKIPTIEVTNEMLWEKGSTAFYCQSDYIEWCFKTAEKYFPANKLVINEATPYGWTMPCMESSVYYAYTEAAMLKGARIDAIGLQYHVFKKAEDEYKETRKLYNPENLYRYMDLYARLQKPLQITEVTVPAYSNDEEDEAIQAEIIEKLYSIWFSHPNVEQIIYWNLVDGYAHIPNATKEQVRESMGNMTIGENYYYGGLIRFDMTPKPAFYKIKELIHKKWHTESEVMSNDNGKAIFRGFYGEYDLEITVNGKKVVKSIKLSSEKDNKITVVL